MEYKKILSVKEFLNLLFDNTEVEFYICDDGTYHHTDKIAISKWWTIMDMRKYVNDEQLYYK